MENPSKEHFYVSPTGSIFMIYRIGFMWYLMYKNSNVISPFMSTGSFKSLDKFARKELGLSALR